MKPIRLFLMVVVLGLMTATTSLAQNRYFSDGDNGALLQFLGAKAENVSSLGGGAVVTLKGRLDLGFSYATLEGGGYLESNEYTPRLGVALARPDSTSPWGVDLWGSYTWVKFRGEYEDRFGGTVWVVGTDISLHLQESQNVRFIPTLGFGFGTVDRWQDRDGDGQRSEFSNEEFLLGLEFSIYFEDLVVVAPQMTVFDGDVAWGITVGLAINGGGPDR